MSPFQYCLNALRINQFYGLDFQDDGCANGQHLADNNSALYCNGDEYLDTLNLGTSPASYLKISLLALGGFAVICFMLAYIAVRVKIKQKTG